MQSKPSNKPVRKSRFASMAGRPGGVSQETAIATADRTLEEMKPRYLDWVARDLQALERLVAKVTTAPGAAPEGLDAVYTKASQIRDLGATFDFSLTTEVADRLCELVHRLRNAGIYGAEAVMTHLAALQLVCTESYRGRRAGDEQALLDGLSKVVAKFPPVSGHGGDAAGDRVQPN